MRYLCEHCGAGGASGKDTLNSPAAYNCHKCDRDECMWPEPVMLKLQDARRVAADSVFNKCQVPNGATHILIDHNQVFFFLKAKGEGPIRYYAGAGKWNLYPTRQLAERDLMSPRCLALPPPIEGELPPVDWEGYYTRKGGTRWFWCVVVAHDQGKAVIRTKSGLYHAHSPDEFEFSKEPEGYRV